MSDFIDLAIPRGGKSLIQRVAAEAKMPVLKHFDGVCHVYVDAAADLDDGRADRREREVPAAGNCNAAECLLVHRDVADAFLPQDRRGAGARGGRDSRLRTTRRLIPSAKPATEADYRTEYLDLVMSVKVVADLAEAAAHIAEFGSHHTDAIVTRDLDCGPARSRNRSIRPR